MGSLQGKVEKAGRGAGRGDSLRLFYMLLGFPPQTLSPQASSRAELPVTLRADAFLGHCCYSVPGATLAVADTLPCARACQPNEHSVKSSVPVSPVTQMNKPRPLQHISTSHNILEGRRDILKQWRIKASPPPLDWGLLRLARVLREKSVCVRSWLPVGRLFPRAAGAQGLGTSSVLGTPLP